LLDLAVHGDRGGVVAFGELADGEPRGDGLVTGTP
jgi:hypothetical protein